MSLLNGKRGVILGVANEHSIAWACAKACAAEGAALLLNYLGESQERRVRKLIEEIPDAHVFPCDVSKDEEIAAFFDFAAKVWGQIDFVVHSVAYADRQDLVGKFVDTSRSNFAMALDISAYSFVAVSRAAAALMPNGGSILTMTYYGSEKALPNYNIMGVAKAALEAAARYLAADLGPKNIRVNCVSPGPLKTLSASAISGLWAMLEVTQRHAPLRRNVTQDEAAKTALYLLSDLASGVTGEVVHVDAGYHILGMYGLGDVNAE